MSKKLVLVLAVIVFFSGFNLAQADVVINEIMYAPQNGANYEWVEIHNDGDESVNLNGWRFFHGETSGPLTLRNGGDAVLAPGEYAIIAKSPSSVGDYSWLDFSGMILSASTLSLPDSGDNTSITIASDSLKTINDSVTYDPGQGGSKESGDSLSKINNSWTGAAPTPGKANSSSSGAGTDDDEENDAPGSGSNLSSPKTTPETKLAPKFKIKAEIAGKTLAYAGIPLQLEGKAFGTDGTQLFRGRYFWNFGDGDFREVKVSRTEKFTHTYFYPGEYDIVLDYYPNFFADTPDASQKITVRVVKASVSISRVGDEKDFFVELYNNDSNVADISNWSILSATRIFKIPRNTILAPKKKIVISPMITGFTIADRSTLKLINPAGESMFDYSSPAPEKSPAKNQARIKEVEGMLPGTAAVPGITGENLLASSIESGLSAGEGAGRYPAFAVSAASILLIAAGAGSVYFIRRKEVVLHPEPGSDFEILDE